MAREFEQLLPFTWRGLHLPLIRIGVSLAHDLVEHKYWGVDGGRVEATGIAPVRISAVIPITNSIVPGKNEKWAAGGLYPDALRKFMIEFAKKATGYVQHPEFGQIACKPEKYEFEFAGERQDYTEIHASWVETLDDEVLHKIVPSPVQDIELAASDLEASGADLRKLVPELPEFSIGLLELVGRLSAFADLVSVLSYRAVGLVNRILYQAHRLEVSIKRAATGGLVRLTSLRPGQPTSHALTWPAIQALQRIKAGAYSMRRALLSPGGVGLYTVPATTTLAGVSLSLPGVPVSALLKLNPTLARGPVVAKGTVVRYLLPT